FHSDFSKMRFLLLLFVLPAIFARPPIEIPKEVKDIDYIALAKRFANYSFFNHTKREASPIFNDSTEGSVYDDVEESVTQAPFVKRVIDGRSYKMYETRTGKHKVVVRRYVPDYSEDVEE
ncbi:hypothetical protein PFISCL1PPCAC_7572, partial [Pristionchus fissidentatus]